MTWTAFNHNFTKDNKLRMAYVPSLNVVYAVNWIDEPQILEPNTSIDFTDNSNYYSKSAVTLIPKCVIFFGQRVYFINCKVNGTWRHERMYRSSLVDTVPLTWAADNWISFDDDLVGAGKVGDNLLVGCENSMWYLTLQDQKFQISSNGCVSHESICSYSKYGFWASRDGMYAAVGGDEQKISVPIQEYWDAIPEANLPLICAATERHFLYVYIGDVTVGGVAMQNVIFKYNILQNNWNRLSLTDVPRSLHSFVTTSGRRLFMGDNDGKVYQMFTGGSQNGTEIPSSIETEWQYGSGEKTVDNFRELWAFGTNMALIRAFYKADDMDKWIPIGEFKGSQDCLKFSVKACRIKFSFQEISTNHSWELHGFKYGYEPSHDK